MPTSPRRSAAPAEPAKPTKRPKIDWDAIERDYRTGKFTTRELGSKYGISHVAIYNKAKAKQWTQDLSEHIRQATQAKLTQALVNSEVNQAYQAVNTVVDIAAEVNAQIVQKHRAGLQRLTSVKEMLLAQVEQAAMNLPDLAEVIELVRNPDENGQDKANDALKKALGRAGLVDDLKKLAEIDERVRKGEREAHNLDSPEDKAANSIKPKRIYLDFEDVEVKPQ